MIKHTKYMYLRRFHSPQAEAALSGKSSVLQGRLAVEWDLLVEEAAMHYPTMPSNGRGKVR